MKFSVLLPTRNGGDYLENCLCSILDQKYEDFEVVVSDNANTDDTHDILTKYSKSPRLKVVRQEIPISVAENWTAALQASHGEYLLMMGDDDFLMPDALSNLDRVLTRHEGADCILFNGYSYVAPHTKGTDPTSQWSPVHFKYGPEFTDERILSLEERLDIVHDMFRFVQRIPLNMQTTLFARSAMKNSTGTIFTEPFPDHYLLNAMLLTANRWVYHPQRLVIVGVSPKSFGKFFYTENPNSGLKYLSVNTDFRNSLPGNVLLNGMYSWLLNLKSNFPNHVGAVEIDRFSYVTRQMYYWLQQLKSGNVTVLEFLRFLGCFRGQDWLHLFSAFFKFDMWRQAFRKQLTPISNSGNSLWNGLSPIEGVHNIKEFSDWIGAKSQR